ncbi:mammalian cell entry protein [Mycobacterium sp. MYCO198283]|uniref:mammalian cell entry protein n=1 Tax=Mycobacterium sp. MYCO198283 TaxID=2883505 RepID=UPI001E34DB79|nr:mammalian cell entry protein [Mycobacterium sp. MYCO198283]MCG5431340.1 mammalian cell entry protein [Mycobacterium sp. MYCO198283]
MTRRMRAVTVVLSSLLVAAIVAAGAVSGYLFWEREELVGAQATRDEVGPIAARAVPAVLGFDFQTIERSLTEAEPLLTPEYRRAFRAQADRDVIPEARQRQVNSQINVTGYGVMDATRNSASVLVYLTRTVTAKGATEPVFQGSRVRVDVKRVDGKWLVNFIEVL